MKKWILRQIGIFIGSVIGHFIVCNTTKELIINILIITYAYSFYDAYKTKNLS